MSTTAGLTEYQKLLDAVASYYGAESDQWLTIASQSNIQSTEWAEILSQTPNVNVVTNNAGEVISYTVNDTFGTASGAVSEVINSNAQAATMANPATVNIPANTTITQTGTVAADSGMKTAAAGTAVSTVIKNVALGVGAVAVGVRAGVKLSDLIYTHGSYIWGREAMYNFNPQTWDSIATTENGKNLFNMVLGIDKNTGKTQPYMDENAFAYILGYMASLGMFSENAELPDYSDTGTITITGRITPTELLTKLRGSRIDYSGIETDITNFINTYYTDDKICVISYTTTEQGYQGSSPLTIQISSNDYPTGDNITLGDAIPIISLLTSGQGEVGEPIVLTSAWTATGSYSDLFVGEYNNVPNSRYYISNINGTMEEYEGVDIQTGATVPDAAIATMTIPAILAYLRTLYPDMFDNAIYNDVVQPDGQVKRFTYVPVAFPDGFTFNETTGDIQPTGGQTLTQANPTIDPTITPVSTLDTLLKILEGTDPYNPTTPPNTPTTNYPVTGGGTTPPVVIPTGSASALYSIYNPSQSELNSFGAWLWSSNFVDQLLKIFNDPMQAIIGLHKVFATPPTSGTGNIKVGYLDSGVSAKLVSNQYSEIDCGSVNLREYFGNALDYINTDIYIYLPFIGIVPLNVSDVMRSTINVKYKVDVLTGACLCSVNVTRDNAGGQLYTYAGNCSVQYPLSSGSYMGIITGALSVAGSVAATIASGGAALPLALGIGASAFGGAKTKIEHSGALSGNAGAMGIKKPYLIIRRPQTAIADNYFIFDGGSNNKTVTLSSCSGFTRVKSLHLENIPATDKELDEIETLLHSGVII